MCSLNNRSRRGAEETGLDSSLEEIKIKELIVIADEIHD